MLPDVWMEYAAKPKSRFELLLTPHNRSDAPTLARALRERLKAERAVAIDGQNAWEREHSKGDRPRILFNESVVLADFSFWETIRVAMSLTDWWKRAMAPIEGPWTRENLIEFVTSADNYRTGANRTAPIGDPKLIKKLISIVGAIERDRQDKPVPVDMMRAVCSACEPDPTSRLTSGSGCRGRGRSRPTCSGYSAGRCGRGVGPAG